MNPDEEPLEEFEANTVDLPSSPPNGVRRQLDGISETLWSLSDMLTDENPSTEFVRQCLPDAKAAILAILEACPEPKIEKKCLKLLERVNTLRD